MRPPVQGQSCPPAGQHRGWSDSAGRARRSICASARPLARPGPGPPPRLALPTSPSSARPPRPRPPLVGTPVRPRRTQPGLEGGAPPRAASWEPEFAACLRAGQRGRARTPAPRRPRGRLLLVPGLSAGPARVPAGAAARCAPRDWRRGAPPEPLAGGRAACAAGSGVPRAAHREEHGFAGRAGGGAPEQEPAFRPWPVEAAGMCRDRQPARPRAGASSLCRLFLTMQQQQQQQRPRPRRVTDLGAGGRAARQCPGAAPCALFREASGSGNPRQGPPSSAAAQETRREDRQTRPAAALPRGMAAPCAPRPLLRRGRARGGPGLLHARARPSQPRGFDWRSRRRVAWERPPTEARLSLAPRPQGPWRPTAS